MIVETKRSIEKNYLYTQNDENLNFVGHMHSSFEFITVTEGSLDCMIYEDRFTLTKGKALLIMPNHIHRYETKDNSKSFLCIFSPDYVVDFYNDIKISGYVGSFFDFVDEGEIEYLNRPMHDKYFVRSVLYRIVGHACKNLMKNSGGGRNAFALETRVMDYVRENYDKEISLKNMAADLGYNYSYLSDMFNKVFGCGFSGFVNRLRVEDAAELLKTTDHSIAKISAYCGFNNIRNLNLCFRQYYGKTPTAYRKEALSHTDKTQ